MEKPKRGHVLVLTYPAQGHINPLLQFAKCLASQGLKITFATTHYTLNSIHTTNIQVHPISDGYDDGGFKKAPNLQVYLESFKVVGSRTLTELILQFKDSISPVNCLVYDSLIPWALNVARELGIQTAVFLTNSACVCSMYWHVRCGHLSLPVMPENIPVVMPGVPSLGLSDIPSFMSESALYSPYLAMIMEMFSSLKQNDWVFINTFEDLEFELTKAMAGRWPLKMVGPMVPSAYLDGQIEGDTEYGVSLLNPTTDKCLKWLETKLPGSVVYVSFGSMAELPAEQVEEMAYGLKKSNKSSLWVVKENKNEKTCNEILNSIDEMGLIVTWCNQLEILAHRAVGCFVTHCGWNSTLEALSIGVPMVAMPQWSDQPTNAKHVEEVWGVGVRAKKDKNGVVTRDEVEFCIREVMAGDSCEEIRRNAMKWRELARKAVGKNGSSGEKIHKFAEVMMNET